MAKFQITTEDGQVFEVETEAPSREDSALQRFSQGAIASGAQLLENARAGSPLNPVERFGAPTLLERATEAGVTSPEALTREDFATTLGRAAGPLPLGFARGTGAMVGEIGSAIGSAAGEFVGRQVGGDVGAAVGGLSGALVPSVTGQGVKRLLAPRAGAQAALEASQTLGTPVGVSTIGGSPLAQSVERISGALPGGRMAATRKATRIGLAAARKAEDVAGRLPGGRSVSGPEGAGRALRKGFGDFIDRFKTKSDVLFRDLEGRIGSASIEPQSYRRALNELVDEVQRGATASSRGFSRSTIRKIEQTAQNFADDVGTQGSQFTGSQLDAMRRSLGREIQDADIIGTPLEGIAKKLHGAVTDDMRRLAHSMDLAARQAGQKPGNLRAFEHANGFYRSGLKRIRQVQREVIDRGTAVKTFEALERAARGGPETIRQIRRSVSPKHWDAAVKMVIRRMGQTTPGATVVTDIAAEPERAFSLSRFMTNWSRFDRNGGLRELFRGQGPARSGAMRDLNKIADIAAGNKELIKILENPSKTSDRLTAAALTAGGLAGAATGYLIPAFQAVATIAPGAAAINYLIDHPSMTRWIAAGLNVPLAQLPNHIERLQKVVESDPETAPVAQAVLDQFRP